MMSGINPVDSDYQRLGELLKRLTETDEVKALPNVLRPLQETLKFHKDLWLRLEHFPADYASVVDRVAKLDSDPTVKQFEAAHNELRTNYEKIVFNRYWTLVEAGADPVLICRVARLEGVDDNNCIKMLCGFFDLTSEDAQAIVLKAM